MDSRKLEAMVGLHVELDCDLWEITAINPQKALVSRDMDGDHQIRNIDTSTCLLALVVDESVDLDVVQPRPASVRFG